MIEKGIVLEVHPHTKSGTGSVQSLKPKPHGSLQNVLRYFSGFCVGAGQKKAQVQLEGPPEISRDTAQHALPALCPIDVAPGTPVLVQLSPDHIIQAKPWSLMCAVLVFGLGIFLKTPLLGFGVALTLIVLPFFKMRQHSISYEPMIVSTLEKNEAICRS